MLRRLLMSVLAAVVSLAGLLAPGAATAATATNAATAAACTGGVSVKQFAFNPAGALVGSHSNLTLVLQNCGSQTVRGSTIWYGRYGYLGDHCPVVDPSYPYPFTIAPGGRYTLTRTYSSDPGVSTCQPPRLTISASVSVAGVGTVATPTAALHFVEPCGAGDGLLFDYLDFNPLAVPVGQFSTATLVLQNCTSQVATGTTTWTPQLTRYGGPYPLPGCPVLDPVASPYSIAPGATATVPLPLGDPVASCPADALDLAVDVYKTGTTSPLYTSSVRLGILQPTPFGCQVMYTPTKWPGGFTADVTITNTGTAPMNGWSLGFAFSGDQKITRAWNATFAQSDDLVTVSNLAYDATIAPGASQSIGIQGTWTESDLSPPYFVMNGEICS